jgi:two-component system NarL family response regulator
MTASGVIRVMVVDDHHMVRRGIAALLATEPGLGLVAEAADGDAALAAFRQHRPDVTLMDLRMPGMAGVDAIEKLRAEFPGSKFIVLTTYDDEDIRRALGVGASGYLLKGMSFEELVGAIRAVHAGGLAVPPNLALRAARHPPHSDLSAREHEVLQLMAKGSSNRKIARQLDVAESTVKSHVNNILWKLGVDARTEAVVVAIKRGLVRVD